MNAYPSIKQGFGILGIFLIATILCGIISLGLKHTIGDEPTFFITYMLSVGATFFIVNKIRKDKTSEDGFNFQIADQRILPYIVLVALAIPFGITAPLTSLIPMNDFMKQLVLQIGQYNGVWGFVTIVIVGPILEELIFRGIVLDGFLKRYSPLKSILLSSALFGIFHMNPWQFITAMIIGSFMGWIYYRTRSITLAILIHILNNLVAFVSMQFSEITMENLDENIIEYYGGMLPFASIILASVTVIAFCLYVLNRKMDKAPQWAVDSASVTFNPTSVETFNDAAK